MAVSFSLFVLINTQKIVPVILNKKSILNKKAVMEVLAQGQEEKLSKKGKEQHSTNNITISEQFY